MFVAVVVAKELSVLLSITVYGDGETTVVTETETNSVDSSVC